MRSILFYHRFFSFFMILLLMVYTTGCNYYKASEYRYSDNYGPTLEKIGEIQKYFLVHFNGETYALENIKVDESFVSGELIIPNETFFYLRERPKRYMSEEKDVLHEVHFYLNDSGDQLELGEVQIPYNQIAEIHVINKDTGKSVISVVGATIGIIVLATVLVILIKGSCPYIYVNDGTEFVFQGEAFGGAIGSNLERDDYMPLPLLQTVDDQYRIRISNELKEIQYTDLAELVVVNHENGVRVLMDRLGGLHTVQQLHPPMAARSTNDQDLSDALASADRHLYSFNEISQAVNTAYLTFVNPGEVETGKLVIRVQNSYWLEYISGRFFEYTGGAFDEFMARQEQLSPQERRNNFTRQHMPISIYQKVGEVWQLVDRLHSVGPLADRELVIPVELSPNQEGLVEIKLETGFNFWDIDYAGMDFSEPISTEVTHLQPIRAFGTGDIEWTEALTSTDQHYMVQENIGEVTELVYAAVPCSPEEAQTAFLHTRGYYELIRDYEGPPQIRDLKKFQEPGYLAEFSLEEYFRFLGMESEVAEVGGEK